MATRIDVREEDKGVYPVEVIYGSEGCSVRMVEQSDMAITITESDGMSVQVYNEEIDKLIEALQEIKKYIPSSAEEDMSDPANWRAGDVVECLEDLPLHDKGCTYELTKWRSGSVLREEDDFVWSLSLKDKDEDDSCAPVRHFKWVSRPSK